MLIMSVQSNWYLQQCIDKIDMKKAAFECWFMNINVMDEASNSIVLVLTMCRFFLLQSWWSHACKEVVSTLTSTYIDTYNTHRQTHTHTAAMGFLGAQYKKCTEGSHIQLERPLHTKGKQWTHTLTHTVAQTYLWKALLGENNSNRIKG